MSRQLCQDIVDFVREIYGEGCIPLHRPLFEGNERQYLVDCIDSNFVSSVGARVSEFERMIAAFTGSRFAVATVNGTAALHVALQVAGVRQDDEVVTQALTFIATCNALRYTGANPVFVDVDRITMGMCPNALHRFLVGSCEKRDGGVWNKMTGRRLAACVPMHTFGFPCRIEEIHAICSEWGIPLVEDAAESLGSFVGGRHTGTFGLFGTLSFNGNKIITTGGGGMVITDDVELSKRLKHITTTAKIPHSYEFVHDEVGYNYRLPNLNAALGCAQMERLPRMLEVKRMLAERYRAFFAKQGVTMAAPRTGDTANNWLNAIVLADKEDRDMFLTYTNQQGVMTRPIWRLMSELEMFKHCQHDGLENSRWLEERVVNIPSSVPDGAKF
ncbi:MAG: LegC family aminotransferase [Magnetococcales bacterium]|nr:LegC family aminotransferase [Magnetococcales bacterium]